jgi:hypothetical protein
MTVSRALPSRPDWRAGSPGKRLLAAYLVSLLLHGLLLFGLTGGRLASPPRLDKSPVYQVDLVHKPVLNPQAGRPEPRTAPSPPVTTAPPAEKVPVRAATPTKPSPAAKTPARSDERHVSEALQRLRDEQALRERVNALRRGQAVPAATPVGLPNARGNEAGVSPLLYIQAFIQQNWALSPYLLSDPRKMVAVSATVQLVYSKSGRLESFRFEAASGDTQFDESIKRALVKSRQLPQPLPERMEISVTFNLKEMAEMRL